MTSTNTSALDGAIVKDNGDIEVKASWAAQNKDSFRFIDVREPHELAGPLGAAEGAENIPLLQLLAKASTLDASTPVVLICRSGRRSSQAARALREAGIKSTASVEGGMIAWNVDVLGRTDVRENELDANTKNLSEAIYRTNGLPEVSAQWVQHNVGRFRLVDVREPHELTANGRIAWAENIPLQTFMAEANAFDRTAPLVVSCASGGRSGRVVRALEAAGFKNVASMEGGIFGWKAYGLPWV